MTGLCVLALIVVLGGGVWILGEDPRAPRQRLPDGTVLTLEGVTYGKQHSRPAGAWWKELAGKIRPAPRGSLSTGPFQEERLVFWFSRSPSYWTVAQRGPAQQDAYADASPYPFPGTF